MQSQRCRELKRRLVLGGRRIGIGLGQGARGRAGNSASSTSPPNSSASARRLSPPRSAPGGGWRWVSTLGGRGPHSRVYGQLAWRRLSGALNKHAVIIRGLRSSGDGGGDFARLGGTTVPGAGPDSELILSLCLPCHPAEGARRAGREEKPALKTHTQGCGGARDWGRRSPQWKPLARERPQSGFVQPLLGPGSALSAGSVWR